MKDKATPSEADILRQEAEEQLKNKSIKKVKPISDIEILKLIHELEVHQIELEMQHDELLLAKKKADTDAEKYTNLYDFAPSGYFTLSKDAEIKELNFRCANLLGKERSLLLNKRFALFVSDQTRPIFNIFLEKLLETKTTQSCEISLTNLSFYVNLSGISSEDGEQCLVTMQDISQLKKAEIQIKISEEKYRALFESNRDSITIFRLDSDGNPGKFIETNKATTEIFGYSKAEFLTQSIKDIEIVTDKRIETYKFKEKINFETIIKDKEGNQRNVEIEATLISYLDEPAVMYIIRDITERKLSEDKIRKVQENLATILESIPDILFEVGIDGKIYHYQTHDEDLLALPPSKFMGKTFQETLPADVAKTCMEAIEEADKKGWSAGKQYALDLKQGRFWFEISVSPIKGKNILDTHFILIARDITNRKMAEEKLRDEKERIRTILELAGNPIFLKDNDHRITYANSAFNNLFGFDKESVIGKTLVENITKDEIELCFKIDRDVLDTGIPDSREEKITVKGVELTIIASKTRFIEESGIKSLVGSIFDITDRKNAEKALENEKRRLAVILIGTGAGTWEWNIQTGATIFNDQWAKIIGYTLEELAPVSIETWTKYTHPDDLKCSNEKLEKHFKGELDFYENEARMKHKNGDWIWVLDRGKINEWDLEGKPLLMSGTHLDITEKKQAEKAKEVVLNLFNTITSHLPGVVYQYLLRPDGSSCFPFASDGIAEIFDLTPEEVREDASKVFATVHPDDYEALVASIQKSAKYLTPWKHEYCIKVKDGEVRHLYGNAKPQKLDDGSVLWHGYILDISEKKISENSLKESEEKYRSLVENSPDGVVIYIDDKIAFINSEGVRMLGAKSKEEIIGKHVFQFVHPASIKELTQRMKEIVADNYISTTVEEKFIRVDGTPFDVEVKGIPTFFEHKKAVQIIVHDITLRKQTSIELYKINRVYALISQINNLIIRTHNQEELFQEICNIAVNFGKFRMSWIGLLNDDNKILTAAYSGYENGYFAKSNITIKQDVPEGRGPTGIAMRERRTVICNDIAKDKMMKIWRKDALERGYYSVISIPIIVRNKIIGAFNLYSDETNFFSSEQEISLLEKIILNISFALEKIQIEQDRRITEEKIRQLSQAVEQSPVTIVITNTKGEIEYVNPKFVETTGYTLEEVVSQNPRVLKSGYTSTDEYKMLWNTISKGKEWHGEFHNKRKNGTLFWESASISPIVNIDGQTTHFIAIKEDITHRKDAEKELVKSKERAEESDRLKLVFLANMSHEIRTPMNGILGFTELLKEPYLSGKEQQEYIEIIEKSGKRMLNIINDIISISKVESGQIEVSLSETNINEQIQYIQTFFKPEAKLKGIELYISKQLASEDALVKTDREKIYAVLTNLVKNALKFTNEGSIEFGCEKKGNHLEFFIKDTGLGISKSQIKIIFERFRQADETISRTHEGSGLGLAISKAYIEMLGGKIWVESKQGKGSTFYFTIPLNVENKSEKIIAVEKEVSVVKESKSIKNLKVLIVEDDAISKLLIIIAVKPYSKEILKVNNGLEAIEACRNNPDIDLVMMDINMPEMGGYEATKNIRKFNKDLIIIAQTANGMKSDRDNAIAAGCTDYISKPIDITSLGNLIQKYFSK
ncbi:PAS domain S-box protein [Flavobacterium franklandianum]|uniref:histidine kinase n=1 Tax=Flavobacterium franklandianum TaxID=2594430 RepID=A0A553C760_9FLAO|nr:PAS domain S-box protein [Flavobacterium franklandianum]TRX16306.1 PAS domain S-box protein [Flavobacterium franklandianum]